MWLTQSSAITTTTPPPSSSSSASSSSVSSSTSSATHLHNQPSTSNGRKRRPSNSLEDLIMDDCMAAMVLMSLSCSPKSSLITNPTEGTYSASSTSIDSGVNGGSIASRTTTPSPPTLTGGGGDGGGGDITHRNPDSRSLHKDEGIEMDETIDFVVDDANSTASSGCEIAKKGATRIVFQCTWPGCGHRCEACEDIEKHVRIVHLGRPDLPRDDEYNDHEEEFYYNEIEVATCELDMSSQSSYCGGDSDHVPPSPSSSVESPHSTTQFNLSPSPTNVTGNGGGCGGVGVGIISSNGHSSSGDYGHHHYNNTAKWLHSGPQVGSSSAIFFGSSSAPTWSHLDMARPAHEDPEYRMKQEQRALLQQINAMNAERKSVISSPINIPGISLAHQRFSSKHRDHSMFAATPSIGASSGTASCSTNASSGVSGGTSLTSGRLILIGQHHFSQASLLASSSSSTSASSLSDLSSPRTLSSKVMRLSNTSSPSSKRFSSSSSSSSSTSPSSTTSTSSHHHSHHHHHNHHQWTSLLHQGSKATISSSRRSRTETRKCRKVYGMENRDSWCTQCKWKKACTRFVD
ncbi:uncharacterized protein LOC141853513 [Brevipalpus obovatus]|uniref:uncharacterized protein LOC141853513 n=1 Tax=Brevipalpus obovatus TaxID=246614 RepID=UPI003D9EFC5F